MLSVLRRSVSVTAVLFVCSYVLADPPRLEVRNDGGVVVQGASPGDRVAWMALTRERVQWHGLSRIRYGVGVAGPDGVLRIPHPVPSAPYIVWNIADVGRGRGAQATVAGMGVAAARPAIQAIAGADSITIDAAQAYILYVSPPAGIWGASAADGGGGDVDGVSDGRVTIRMAALRAIEGNRKPPEGVTRGDLIMVIDPGQLRIGQVVVP